MGRECKLSRATPSVVGRRTGPTPRSIRGALNPLRVGPRPAEGGPKGRGAVLPALAIRPCLAARRRGCAADRPGGPGVGLLQGAVVGVEANYKGGGGRVALHRVVALEKFDLAGA